MKNSKHLRNMTKTLQNRFFTIISYLLITAYTYDKDSFALRNISLYFHLFCQKLYHSRLQDLNKPLNLTLYRVNIPASSISKSYDKQSPTQFTQMTNFLPDT